MFVHSVRCQGLPFFLYSFAVGFISAQFFYKQLTPPELKSFSTHFSVSSFLRFLLLPVGIMGATPRLRSGTGAFPRFSVSPFPSFIGRHYGRPHKSAPAFSPPRLCSGTGKLLIFSSQFSTFSSQLSTFFPKSGLTFRKKTGIMPGIIQSMT